MRKLRGEHVVPVVELSAKPMKTQFGTKQRPHFNITDWRNLRCANTSTSDRA
jgi:hypothetical protein